MEDKRMRGSFVLPVSALAAFVLAACGSTSAPTQAASSPTPAASPTVAKASVKVAGNQEMVLTTPAGLTLYYLTSDSATAPKCTAGCLAFWPPLLSTGSPVAPPGLSGSLTVAMNANGSQIAYNGHLLYMFAKDKAGGDANGEGVQAFGGTWHAATPSLAA
jgi:predicted lipoprotein with Yx(FWY)xxD motif